MSFFEYIDDGIDNLDFCSSEDTFNDNVISVDDELVTSTDDVDSLFEQSLSLDNDHEFSLYDDLGNDGYSHEHLEDVPSCEHGDTGDGGLLSKDHNGGTISFKGLGRCTVCSCREWAGFGDHCENCGHFFSKHT